VIQVHDAGTRGDQVFIAMELVDGGSLARWLATGERSVAEIVRMFAGAGRGLAAAHAAGLIHRDFKPDNVLIDRGLARVADFGLAVADPVATAPVAEPPLLTSLTQTGAVVGTLAFMAPEQLAGEPATAAADQFAFCVALYRALYDAWPFAGDTVAARRAAIAAGPAVASPSTARAPAVAPRRRGPRTRRRPGPAPPVDGCPGRGPGAGPRMAALAGSGAGHRRAGGRRQRGRGDRAAPRPRRSERALRRWRPRSRRRLEFGAASRDRGGVREDRHAPGRGRRGRGFWRPSIDARPTGAVATARPAWPTPAASRPRAPSSCACGAWGSGSRR
jgi:hypothetical protein